jgi:predicted aspartyl protease
LFGPLLDHGGRRRPCKTTLNPFPFVGGSYPASYVLRKSNRDYKTGWNSYVPSAPVVTTTPAPAATQPVNPVTTASAGFVQLGVSGGTYTVPVAVNGHPANFTLDSGAAAVQIPASRILQMINEGTMQASDFIRNDVFVDANGNRVSQPLYMLRALTVGGVTVNNVECIGGDDPHTFLLGQSFLSKLPSWSIDNKTARFVIGS